MPLANTPQVTAEIRVNSPNLVNDAMSLAVTTKLTKAGTSDPLAQTTGLSRKTYSSAQTDTTLLDATDYTDDKAHKLYIFNPSTDVTQYITLSVATGATSTNVALGRLYAGDAALFPWSGNVDLDISTSAANMTVEWMLIYE